MVDPETLTVEQMHEWLRRRDLPAYCTPEHFGAVILGWFAQRDTIEKLRAELDKVAPGTTGQGRDTEDGGE